LLETVTTRTLRAHRGGVRLYPGAYGAASAEWQREEEALRDERERLRETLQRAERRLDDARRVQQAATLQRSSRRRLKGVRDNDARSMGTKIRVESGEARAGQVVAVRRAETERAAMRLDACPVVKEVGRALFVDYAPAPKARLLAIDADVIHAGDRPVLHR